MRHGKSFNHLSRKSAHRKSMFANMTTSLIMSKRIRTTVPKAKALRSYAEPVINRAKEDTTHSRRMVFKYTQDKNAVTELFGEVAQKIGQRAGGYTRIIKLGNRLGDNAEMCYIELVDFNELMVKDNQPAKAKTTTRRSRRGGGSKSTTGDKPAAPKKEPAKTSESKQAVAKEAPKATEQKPKDDKKEDTSK